MTQETKKLRVLVCGGRDFSDAAMLENALNQLGDISVIIEGGANGADNLANMYAELHGVPVSQFKADWKTHGRAAGPIRNRQMLDEGNPDVVVALPGGKGTANMVSQARGRGVPVVEIPI